MNRPIKFRGKRIDDGTWVYGSYQADIMCLNKHTIIYSDNEGFYCEDEVIPETVGQFTGLHDRNGKEIYEWDILKTERMTYSDSGEYIGMVEAHGEVIFTNGRYALHLSSGAMPDLHFGSSYHVVLGNRYEHPELLG